MFLLTLSIIASLYTHLISAKAETYSGYPQVEFYNDALTPFAAIFNGTFTFTSIADNQPCGLAGSGLTTANYSLFIGSTESKTYQDKEYKRSLYDTNPFWFYLTYPSTGGTNNDVQLRALSSQGGVNVTTEQPDGYIMWTITASAAGDGWDFDANLGNHDFGNRYNLNSCSKTYTNWPMGSDEGWVMKGHISPTKASFTIGLTDWTVGTTVYSWSFKFEGEWDAEAGTKLLPDLKTDGINKRIARDVAGNLLYPMNNGTSANLASGLKAGGGYSMVYLFLLGVMTLFL
jgi:hypothetical protein